MKARAVRSQWQLKTSSLCRSFFLAIGISLLFSLTPFQSKASEEPYEMAVFFSIQKMGTYIPALIQDETVYLPISDIFSFLKIKSQLSPGLDSVSGFLLDAKATFLIDYTHKQISYNGKTVAVNGEELLRTETNLYLRSDDFGKVFGLECLFNFRSLTVVLNTKLDLPLIRDLRQQVLRGNISKVRDEIKPDTIIRHEHPFFRLGMADWSVIQSNNSGSGSTTRVNIKMGGAVAGGEATASLNYDSNLPFQKQQQFYQWRYVNNSIGAFRQATLGNIALQATSSIFAPVVGVQLTNTPTSRRRSFGTYTVSDHIQPDWMVELYVNNILVDYTKADASGFYTFNVPLVYGNTTVKLKFYGPSGEESSEEKSIQIPFNFLPANTFEYTLSAGVLKDSSNNRFAKAAFNYGLGKRITAGGGIEYLSSVQSGSRMPFFKTTLRPTAHSLFLFEYTYGVRSKSVFTYRLPSNFQLELDYIKYSKGQKAILNNYLEDRKVSISIPFRTQKLFLLSKLGVRQVIAPAIAGDWVAIKKYAEIPKVKFTTTELMFSANISRFSANLTTYGLMQDNVRPNLYSNLSMAYRLRNGIIFRPQLQFDYNQRKAITAKYEVEKQLRNKGSVNLSFERNYSMQVSTVMLGLRFDLSFARTAFSAVRCNKATTLVHSASGSLSYDASTSHLTVSNRSQVGKGGIILSPFLDLNCNGRRDKNEPGVLGLKFSMTSGQVSLKEHDPVIRITELEPYHNYFLELDDHGFGNIAWQIKNKKLSVAVAANDFKLLEVPVAVLGEISGTVYSDQKGEKKGLARIRVSFYDSTSRLVAQTVTESDGFFSFLGLPPGTYTASIDTLQLQKLQLLPSQDSKPFTIESVRDGAVVSGLEIRLEPLLPASGQQRLQTVKPGRK